MAVSLIPPDEVRLFKSWQLLRVRKTAAEKAIAETVLKAAQ
jgi:hypothetical protein